ncbi:MAG: hypothetical protein N2259_00975 [Patescibacteria group bacterium]|nr:hypothetical protein [Patescibacteria group bacterium]
MRYFSILLLLVLPRLLIVLLKLLTNWFEKVFAGWFWLVLGIIFAPFTLLWYSIVINWFNGKWEILQVVVLALAIILDLFALSRFRGFED